MARSLTPTLNRRSRGSTDGRQYRICKEPVSCQIYNTLELVP